VDDVGSYERHLRREAHRRAGEVVGTELGRLFRTVADRRSRRSAAPPREDVASPPAGAGAGTVLSVQPVGDTVRLIRVGRPAGFGFRAGQHVKLGAGGRRASFSIASAPHDDHVEVCVELVPDGRVTPALFALGPGDAIDLDGRAKGSFVLDPAAACHLMVATVTGIAPLRSMLRAALHEGTAAEFVVLHGASHAHELPYLDELLELAASDPRVVYRPTVSRDAPVDTGWPHERGRADELARRVAAAHDPARTRVYACGHPGMVATVARDLGALGFPVSTEVFD
jgi:ferredoxin-NADP reductase